jgi:pyruvate/2-oxoglutarate dehydrogenase complex dihydrolipoamide acyltransferase (E2) component
VKPRTLVVASAVALLAGLNALRWLSPEPPGRSRAAPQAYAAEDFRLRTGVAAAGHERSGRDLFRPKLPPPPPAPKVVAAPPPEPAPAGPPPKTPEELAAEAARDELRQLKLVGVVFRGGKGQAYVVKGDQAYLVHAGERVGERFRVEAIAPEGIQLLDPASRVNGQIPVSGK